VSTSAACRHALAAFVIFVLAAPCSAAPAVEESRLTLGVFPGVESGQTESFQIVDRFIPFAKYLSAKVGSEVLLLPVKLPDAAMQRMAEGKSNYKLFFGPPVFAADAIRRAGFVPVVVEKDRIRATFVVRSASKLQTLKDIDPATRVAMPSPKLLLALLANETLSREGISLLPDARKHMSATEGVVQSLENDLTDVAVMRDRAAKKLLADQPGKYRAIGASIDAPGFALIAHRSVPETARNRLRQATLALNDDSSALGAEARAAVRTSPFVLCKEDEFAELQRVADRWLPRSK